MTTQSYQRILKLLDQHGVEFVVVGGVAAVLQGAPITTFDIDMLVKLDDANAERLAGALTELEATFREQPNADPPDKQDILAGGHLLLLTNCGPLDILGFIGDQEKYEDLQDKIRHISVGDQSVQVLELEELVNQKKAMGRPKDQAALRILESVLRRKGRA
jgi:predicted nucleotidyltransferase